MEVDSRTKRNFYGILRETKNAFTAMEVHLRGRPLHGSNVTLPPNFRGFETTVANNHLKDEVPKVHKLISEFSEFTYWNWDKNPSPMDSHVKLLDWLSASEIASFFFGSLSSSPL